MHATTLLTSILPFTPAMAAPWYPPKPEKGAEAPNVNVTFFSTSNCSHNFPSTIHHVTVFAGLGVDNFPCDSYSSLIIKAISPQFIGTNSALQVGAANSATLDFTNSVKFNIATDAEVGKCQFVGIPQAAPGKPLLSGNEFRLTSLE